MNNIKTIIDNIKPIKEVKLFNAGYCQMYDFSEANSSEEHRIAYVTYVANVCRGDKGIANPTKLYQQLLTEHNGKPGEIFQFIPVTNWKSATGYNMLRFGYFDINKVHTNLRAMLEDRLEMYNDKDQASGFYVFKIKVPLMIVSQILRHGQLSFNQQSERHCKLREYYYCDDMKEILDIEIHNHMDWDCICQNLSQIDFDIYQRTFSIRQELMNKGSHGLAYTTLWIAGWKQDPSQWDNFFAVRTRNPTQIELQTAAKTMQQMMEE